MALFAPEVYASKIASGDVTPVILVTGEEQLLADECIDALVASSIDPSMKDFNLDILDASRSTTQEILAKARSYPMMGERRVVIAQNADRLVSNEGGREALAAYFERPVDSTLLILSATKVDLRKKPFNDIKKTFDVVECRRPQERVLPAWIQSRVRALGKTMDAETASLLLAYAGSSLLGLVGEIEKLSSFVGDRKEISSDDVAEAVGATRGATIFDLLDAVATRDTRKAATIVHRMKLAGEQVPMIVANLANHFMYMLGVADGKRRSMSDQDIASKLSIHPYRVTLMAKSVGTYADKELIGAIHAIRKLDRLSKTSAGDPSVALDMFLVRVLAGNVDGRSGAFVER